MAGQNRNMEGNADQRRKAARDAKNAGERPSARGATTGASKQRKEASSSASHQERLAQRREGKANPKSSGRARPGNRDSDPNRGR